MEFSSSSAVDDWSGSMAFSDPVKRNAYERKWRKANPEAVRSYKRNAYAGNQEHYKKKAKAWKEANREKVRAHDAVYYAIKTGKLTRGKCEECGSPNTHAHHDDYTRKLDVRWLCAVCHAAVHEWWKKWAS